MGLERGKQTLRPNQDARLDLPSMGPQTIEAAQIARLKGVALEAGASLLLERERTLAMADTAGIFVYGWNRSIL
ncbi:MAG: LpxI family protein [Alphaproteobacteria bacterium]